MFDGFSLFTMESCFHLRIHHLTFVSRNCNSLRSYNMTCFLISISIYLLRDWNRLLLANLTIEMFNFVLLSRSFSPGGLISRLSVFYVNRVSWDSKGHCASGLLYLLTHILKYTHTQTHQTSCHCLSPCWICPVKAHVDILCSPNSKHLPSAHWLQPRTWV